MKHLSTEIRTNAVWPIRHVRSWHECQTAKGRHCRGHFQFALFQVQGWPKWPSDLRAFLWRISLENDGEMRMNILVLCTGNSCRSVMTEVLLRDLGRGRVAAYSAGSKPNGKVNATAVSLLQSKGHDVSGLRSKSWDEFSEPGAPELNYVFTVCGNAAGETCPVWIGAPVQSHWGVEDPSDVEGSAQEKLEAYETAYRILRRRVEAFLTLPLEAMDIRAIKSACDSIGKMDD